MRKIKNLYLIISGIMVQVIRSPKSFFSLFSEIGYFYKTYLKFKRENQEQSKYETLPIFFQRRESTFDKHYVYQAYWASSIIKQKIGSIDHHTDVSSNVSYVVQLSAFVPIHFIEYNPPKMQMSDIKLVQGDLSHLPFSDHTVESISCMHVLEHIGLGRYGDPIDTEGMRKACAELSRVLAPGGTLLVSFPVGKPKIVFNAHRVSDPVHAVDYFPGLKLEQFGMVSDDGELRMSCLPEDAKGMNYACGMYRFTKV